MIIKTRLNFSNSIIESKGMEKQMSRNQIRMPRSHNFGYKSQRFLSKEFEITGKCLKCGIDLIKGVISKNEEYLCINCSIDLSINDTVDDLLQNVFWNELYALESQYSKQEGVEIVENLELEHFKGMKLSEVNFDECDSKNMPTVISKSTNEIKSKIEMNKNQTKQQEYSKEKEMLQKNEFNVPFYVGMDLSEYYKKEDFLGSGKFGKVYKVINSITGKLAAAKEIPYRSKEAKEGISNEIEILKYLSQNEFTVQIYEIIDCCITRPKKMIIISEYLEGGNLFDQIANEDILTESKVINIMNQILRGVNFLHNKGIIHRDLKPENMIYQSKEKEKIKIIDFGFAVHYDESNPPKSMVGTTIFIAPEILSYESQSYQTDMWSVGVIAYNLLAGITPFEIPKSGDLERQLTDAEVMKNIERCQYDFDDDGFIGVSSEAKSFISSILVRQPEKRLTSEECFKHPWLNSLGKKKEKKLTRSLSILRMKNYIISSKSRAEAAAQLGTIIKTSEI